MVSKHVWTCISASAFCGQQWSHQGWVAARAAYLPTKETRTTIPKLLFSFGTLEKVVGNKGTGRLVQIENLRIAGKTGTADFRAHGKEVNLAWFIGFAPADNPQIAVAVMVEGTQANHSYHGGSTAGPIAKDIFLKFIEKYPERAGFPISKD